MGKRRTGVYVPRDAWDWLMGCGPDDFEPREEQRRRNGDFPAYWWRSELRRRIDEALKPRKVRRMERTTKP